MSTRQKRKQGKQNNDYEKKELLNETTRQTGTMIQRYRNSQGSNDGNGAWIQRSGSICCGTWP